MKLNTWSALGMAGGTAALTYFASNGRKVGGGNSMRLSIDKDGSLLGDVRLLGGVGAIGASMLIKDKTWKQGLQIGAGAALGSLLITELVRWRLSKTEATVANDLPFIPKSFGGGKKEGMGALPSPDYAWARA